MQSASWKFSDLNPRLSGDLFLYFQKATESLHIYSKINSYFQGITHAALSHEFTHFVEELSAEKFRKFTDVLFDVLGKSDVDVNRLINAKEAVLRNTEEYKGRSEKELRAIAYSEAVAEMMEPVLTDTDAISRISQKIKQQDRSLWGKIKDFIKGIVEKLKAAYRDMEPDSAIARLTRETVTNSEAVLDAFSEAAADAVLNYNLQEGQKNNAREGGLYSLREYTEQQKKNWGNSKRIVIYDNQEQLAQFISDSIANKTMDKKMYFGAIPSDLAARIRTDAGVDVEGFNLSLGSNEIRKILKDHGDPETEAMRGQRAITADDFAHIADVVLSPSNIVLSDQTYNGKPAIIFSGEYNGRMNVVAVVSDKRLDLFVQTVYVNVKKGNLSTPTGEQAPINTPEANSSTVSNANVAQPDAEVKGNFLKSSRDSDGNALTEAQQRYFADSQVRDEDGNLIPVYHRTDGDFTVFLRGKLGGATLSNAADAGLAATSLVGHWFSDHDLGDLIGKNVVKSYLNIQNPYETDLISLAQEIAGFSSNPEMMQEHFENGQYNMVRKAAAEFTAWLRSEGYDGLKVTDQENGGVSYVVLDSRQAKLTTNQNPTGARDLRYSSRTSSDSEYLNLAQNPEENREALSRMVEQAAREAGYDSPMLYHGTQSFGFTNFDLDKMDDKRSIFLTSNPDIAATYSGVDGSRNIGKASGTDINTLSLQEVAQMMNQFPPESGMDYQYSVVESKAEISGQVDRGLNELNNLINTLKKQYGKDSKEYGRLEKLQNTLYLGTNDGLSTQLWMILKQTDLFKGHEDFVNGLEQNLRLLKKAPESGSFLVEKALGGYSIDVLSESDAKEELAQNMQRGNYALYARLGNTLTVEGEGQRWNNLKNWARGMEVDENSTYVMEDDGKFFLLRKADDSVVENGVIEATEKARELSPDALQFLLIQKANTSLRILTEVATTTRDVTKWAKNAGYDSVIFKNIKDSGGQNNSVSMDTTADIYVIFNPNNAKSADAVTYDDNGNVIPLSQRFDAGKEDIRYSARNPQTQVEAENERLKSDVQSQIAEAVREYRRQQDVQSKAYRQMYERQLEEVKKSYQKQISTMEAEYSANLAQIQDAFFQTVEAYEKGQFRNEHLEKVLKQAAETQRAQAKASEADNATWEKEFKRLLKAYETSGRNVERLKQTVEAQRARAKAKVEAARVTEQRGKLYRAVNEINRRLLNPTKTLYVPDSLAPAVTKFMQGLTEAMESPKNSWNVQGALETLQGQYQKLTQMNEGVFTQEYNQGILDLLDNAINAVGGTDFNKLSAGQIEDVYSAVRSVLTAIRNENKMFAANLNKTYAEAAEAVLREEAALPNRKPTTGAVQDKAEKFGWNQLKPVYAMMRLGSDTLLKQYNNLRAGEDKWQRVIAAARAYGLGIMAKYHYDQWNDSLMKLDTETGTVELSLEERMSLYAYARREQAFEHLTKGGFVLSDKNTRTVKNRFGIKTEQI